MNKAFLLVSLLLFTLGLFSVTITETEFIGNKSLSNQDLYSVLSYQNGYEFDYQIVEQSLANIYNLYQQKGYKFIKLYPLEVIPLSVDQVKIIFKIEESALNIIASINFSGNYAIKDIIFYDLLTQKDYTTNDINLIKQLIINQYSSRGYFFTEVKIESIKQTESGAEINFLIKENKPFEHKYFKFRGNKVSRDYSLIKISRLNRKTVLTPNTLTQATNRLLAKSYITKCSINPVDYETLLIDVKEGKMTNISGILGYNSKNEDYPFSGFLDFSFNNLFGSDRILKFKWNKLQKDRTDLALAYHETGLKDYYFSSDIEVKRTEYDTIATLSELNLALNYDFTNQDIGIYTKYSYYDVIASSSEEAPEKITALGIFWQQNYFDHLMNPKKGYQIRFSIDYNMSSLDDSNYNISRAMFAYAILFKDKFVLYNKLNTSYSTKKNLSSYNSFKLGGFSSLRGFQEEQFSGYFTSWSNLELRYLFGQENNLFLFNDAGYLETMNSQVVTKQGHLYSAGLGLRIATKLGNLTFEYGVGYNEGWNSLYDGLIHFGLETSF